MIQSATLSDDVYAYQWGVALYEYSKTTVWWIVRALE